MLKFIINNQINLLFLILITYSQYYSPVISDDWFYHKNYNFFMADRPLASLLIVKIHKFINYELIYDGFKIFKIIYLFAAYFLLYKFYTLIIEENYAKFFSFFSIFYPIHDSANYQIWFIGHLLIMIFPLFGYYLFHIKKSYSGYFIFGISSFFSYSSLPTQFAIILNYLKNKNYLRFSILLFLLFAYIIYYFFVSYYLNIGLKRVGIGFDGNYIKIINEIISIENISIHIFSFFDLLFGPSHLIKIILSIFNNSIITIIISFLLSTYLVVRLKNKFYLNNKYFKQAFFIITISLLTAQILFLITTKFINIPFGLGNRTNIYISLFIVFIILYLFKFFNTKHLFFLTFIFFLTFFGNINNWKNVNNEIKNIKYEIISLSNSNKDKNIFLKNVEYINFFKFKHIELLNFQHFLDSFIISNNINTNGNSFYILKDINVDIFKNKKNLILYNFNNKQKTTIYTHKQLINIYDSYISFYQYRHWLQFFDFSKIVFLLPEHYKKKFINLSKRD